MNLKRGFNRLFIVAWLVWIGFGFWLVLDDARRQRDFWISMIQFEYSQPSKDRDQQKIDEYRKHFNELTTIPVLKTFFKEATTTWVGWIVVVGFAAIIPALVYGMSIAAFLIVRWVLRGFRSG